MTAVADRPELELAEVGALLRDRLAWAVAASIVVLTAVLTVLLDDPTDVGALVLFTVIPVAVLIVALSLTLRRGTPLAAGALALAVTPAALAAVAAAEPAGALAVLAGVRRRGPGVVGRPRPDGCRGRRLVRRGLCPRCLGCRDAGRPRGRRRVWGPS